jgi:NTP pyrophosphatase (non-canonical NTP hydrolase)
VTLDETQEVIDRWIREVGVRYYGELTNMAVLMEEVGEVARLMSRMYGEQSFKNPEDAVGAKDRLADELADVFFVLVCLCNQTGINLNAALEKNLQKKSIRDADRHRNNPRLRD